MKTKITIVMLVLLAVSMTSVYAGTSLRTGTAGALELAIPVGSRGTSMGGAVVANTYGVEAIVWNPAGMARYEGTEATFSYQSYLADIDVNFFGVSTSIEDFGSVGISAKIVSIGEMEETTQDYPEGTGRIFNPTLAVIGLTYARDLTNRVSFGATAKFVREDIFEVSASGIAFDAGFIYDMGWNGISLGLAVKNYGPEMKFTGRGFQRDLDGRLGSAESASFDLPASIDMGLAYMPLNDEKNMLTFSGCFRSNAYSLDAWQGGAEYSYDNTYFLRGGYNFSDDDEWLYGFSVGAGVKLSVGGTDFSFEYSWAQTEVFDDNQYFTVKAGF